MSVDQAQMVRTVEDKGDGADYVEAHGQELVPLAGELVVYKPQAVGERKIRMSQLREAWRADSVEKAEWETDP